MRRAVRRCRTRSGRRQRRAAVRRPVPVGAGSDGALRNGARKAPGFSGCPGRPTRRRGRCWPWRGRRSDSGWPGRSPQGDSAALRARVHGVGGGAVGLGLMLVLGLVLAARGGAVVGFAAPQPGDREGEDGEESEVRGARSGACGPCSLQRPVHQELAATVAARCAAERASQMSCAASMFTCPRLSSSSADG